MSVEQGEVYWADLNPATGREVSRNEVNRLPLTVLVMAGSGAEHYAAQKPFPTDIWVGAHESGLPKTQFSWGYNFAPWIAPASLAPLASSLPTVCPKCGTLFAT